MSIPKIITLIFIAFVAFLGYKAVIADPPGYCRTQQRYITDDEFLKAAVALFEWKMNREYKVYPEGTLRKTKDDIDDGKAYQFWEQTRNNPDCCTVDREQTKSIFNRIFNLQEVVAILYLGLSRGDTQARINFDVCGQLVSNDLEFLDGGDFGRNVNVTTTNYQELINKLSRRN